MAEILSQGEIDALLDAISTGELSAEKITTDQSSKPVKIYDFKRPEKFSKDHIRTLSMLHDSFARLFSSSMSGKLRTVSRLDVVSVDQLLYEEFIRSLSNPSIIAVFSMAPLDGSAVFEINPMIAFPLMDRMLGGPGTSPSKIRELSDIEEGIMTAVVNDALNFLRETWAGIIPITPKLESLESNPQFVQTVPSNHSIILITFESKIAENSGMMSLCYPYLLLEPILSKISTSHWFASVKKSGTSENIRAVEERLRRTKVPFVAQLGRTVLTVKDLISLEVGDIVKLDKPVNDDLEIYVGSRLKFRGRPGLVKNRLAVQTNSIVTESEVSEDD